MHLPSPAGPAGPAGPASPRLTYEEAQLVKQKNGRLCPGCRAVYAAEEAPTSFAADERTRDGLSKLCLPCIETRDRAAKERQSRSRAGVQSAYRVLLRDLRFAKAQAELDAALPDHAVPACALPGYPPPLAKTAPERPAERPIDMANRTRLYGRLRDAGITSWEMLSGKSRSVVADNVPATGERALEMIDEHLRAFGLDLMTP